MIHWQRYSIMRTNQTLYETALRFRGAQILHINFDSIVSTELQELNHAWKHNELTNVRLPYPRAMISDGKIRLPGIRKFVPIVSESMIMDRFDTG